MQDLTRSPDTTKNLIVLMATSINRLVASRVFGNHRVSKGVFVFVKSLRITEQLSLLSQQKIFLFRQFAL